MEPVILQPGEGECIKAGASIAVMKATPVTTGGGFSIVEGMFPPGMSGPPPHAHRLTTDTFYILDGTLHMLVGEREIDASTGSYILVPPGVLHTFANTSAAPVRFLNISTGGWWEHYLRDLAGAMEAGVFPGSAEFAQIVAKYDFVLLTQRHLWAQTGGSFRIDLAAMCSQSPGRLRVAYTARIRSLELQTVVAIIASCTR